MTHRDYRRRHPVTEITERRVVRRVVGLRRRVLWRLRELGCSLGTLMRERDAAFWARHGRRSPMRRDSLWHTIYRRRIDVQTFGILTELLAMDEVDGWNRPWPQLPPRGERVGLVERLTAEGPGED